MRLVLGEIYCSEKERGCTMIFKSNIVHKIVWIKNKPYYKCNRAVGVLSGQQIILKTAGTFKKRVTCLNCKRWKDE
jgi:hypothetical protein